MNVVGEGHHKLGGFEILGTLWCNLRPPEE